MKFLNHSLDGDRSGLAQNAAALIANGGDASDLRTNATLRKDEWKSLDTAVVGAAQKRLRAVADLMSRGLTYNLTNALGTTILETETATDMNDATVNMTGKAATGADNDAVEFEIGYLPIPITSKRFEINARKLAASRKLGQPLDALQATLSTNKVAEKIEQELLTGTSALTYGGGTIYGYTNHPNRATGSLTAAWSSDSARDPVNDVNAMKQELIDKKMYGPYGLYSPTAYETALDEDYTTNYPITLRERIMKLDGLEFLHIADHLTAGSVLLVQLDVETVRIVVGQQPTPIEWSSGDKMTMNFAVLAILVPQIRADSDGNCGIAHYTA